MRLLDRYLLRELLVPLLYCLGAFLIAWAAFDLFADLDKFQERKMLTIDIAEYYLVKLPEFLVFSLPIALLLAVLYALTNHARHNEITAIRAAGVSLWRLSLPYFLVSLVCSLSLLAMNELWVPESLDRAEGILQRHVPPLPGAPLPGQVRNLGFSNARGHRVWQIGAYDLNTGEMFNPQVIWTRQDGSRLWLKADRGAHTNGGWVFSNARQFLETGEPGSMPLPLLQTNRLFVSDFDETPEQIRSEVKLSSSLNLRTAKKADVPITEILNYLRLHPQPSRRDGAWLYTKLHGRLAAPWTCIVVVLIALPFAAASGRRNLFVGVASSIVICFVYFIVQQVGLALGTGMFLAPWLAAWLPNLLFSCAGLLLTARVR
jgi:lipopolysaccharide export system permease protein